MAITYDAASRNTAADNTTPSTGDFNWTHSPSGTPKGVVVVVVQEGSGDSIAGVTYGGISMLRVRSDVRTTTEAGRVYIYFLGQDIPTGDQTVAVDTTSVLDRTGYCGTVTADGEITTVDVVNGADAGIIADPSLTLNYTDSLADWVAFYGLFTGAAAPASTSESGTDHLFGNDMGADSCMFAKKEGTGGNSTTVGYTLASDDVCHSGIVIKEVDIGTAVRLWPSTNGPGSPAVDNSDLTLGCEFEVSSDSYLTGVYWWTATGQGTASKQFGLYQVVNATTGTKIGDTVVSGTFGTNQWTRVRFPNPLPLTASTRYRVVVWLSDNNGYAGTNSYWTTGAGGSGITNGVLTGVSNANATGNDQGSYFVDVSMAYPTNSFEGSNYWIDPEVSPVATGTNAAAESVAISATSETPNASVKPNAEGVAVTASALDATATTSVVGSAEGVSVGASSNDVTSLVSTSSESVSVSASALDATVVTSVVGNAEEVTISATAYDATVSLAGNTNANAEVASVSASANDTSSKIDINSEVAITSVVAHDATIEAFGIAENAPISVTANNSSTSVAPSSGSANVVVSSNDATTTIQSNIESIGITISALDATVQTGSFTVANAECATVVATSNDPSISTIESGNAGNALISLSANDALISTSIMVNAECATIGVASNGASILTEVFANAEVAELVVSANEVSTLISTTVQVATLSVDALNALPSTVVPDPDLIIASKTNHTVAYRYTNIKVVEFKSNSAIISDPGG